MTGQELSVEIFNKYLKNDVQFLNLAGQDQLFHHRRQLQDGQLLFLANVNPKETASGRVILKGKTVEKWQAFTGQTTPYEASIKRGRAFIDFSLKPGESLLLAVYKGKKGDWQPMADKVEPVEILNLKPVKVRRLDPNLLTLDYCDLSLKGGVQKNLYFYRAQQETYQRHGWPKNPWDSGVQYQDEIISRNRFAPGTGFRADFHFQMAAGVDLKSLKLAVEGRKFPGPGKRAAARAGAGEFWLDRNFGIFQLVEAVRPGLNTVSLIVSPFDLLAELEPVYVLGNFALQPVGRGFLMTPAREMALGSWKDQGLVFTDTGWPMNRRWRSVRKSLKKKILFSDRAASRERWPSSWLTVSQMVMFSVQTIP